MGSWWNSVLNANLNEKKYSKNIFDFIWSTHKNVVKLQSEKQGFYPFFSGPIAQVVRALDS